MSHNLFLQMELNIRHQVKTITNPEQFRTYLRGESDGFILNYFSKIMTPGKTAYKIIFEIVRKPHLFKIFLEEGFGINLFRPILSETLKCDIVESLQILFDHSPYYSRLQHRASLSNNGQYTEYFVDILIHTGPNSTLFLLNHDLMKKQFTLENFMKMAPQLTEYKIRAILTHPTYSYFLYAISSPYEWAGDLQKDLYGSLYQINSETLKQYVKPYEYVQKVFIEERQKKTHNNWTFLFLCIILTTRVKEFKARFWIPGGKKAIELQEIFYTQCIHNVLK